MGLIGNLKQGTVWADRFVVGGSGPLQTASNIVLDGSGTLSTAYATNFSGTLANMGSVVSPVVSGANALFTNYSGTSARIGTTVNVTLISGGDFVTPLSTLFSVGSPYREGVVCRSFATEVIITGGMWIVGSAANGNLPVLRAAPASTQAPLGVAVTTVASGAVVDVLTNGLSYFIAEDTIVPGVKVNMGAGGALNCVLAAAAGSGAVGKALVAATSGQQCLVWVGV